MLTAPRACLALILLASCARPLPPAGDSRGESFHAAGIECAVIDERGDREELALVQDALRDAAPRVLRWGSFRAPLQLRVVRDHEALEQASEQRGAPWLRAWTWPDAMLLQRPRTWPGAGELTRAELEEALASTLAHELTHARMYELLRRDDGSFAEAPLWFREGMASVTAGQEDKRMSKAELQRFANEHTEIDLLDPSPADLREHQPAVYSAAHHAFADWSRSVGDGGVLALFARLRAGTSFREAMSGRAATTAR